MTNDDDLDAFFDEVSDVVNEVKSEKEKDDEESDKPPPAKKLKRPLGVVVAASSSKVVAPREIDNASSIDQDFQTILQENRPQDIMYQNPAANVDSFPPPPPPPPPKIAEPTRLPASNKDKNKAHLRSAAGQVWKDHSLSDWPDNDYRLFVGNLSKDVNDPELYEHFAKYSSLQMVKVIRDTKGLSKGYGFVSLMEPMDCAKAIREMDQSWLSSRPIKVKRSDWKDRELKNVKKKRRQQNRKLNRSL